MAVQCEHNKRDRKKVKNKNNRKHYDGWSDRRTSSGLMKQANDSNTYTDTFAQWMSEYRMGITYLFLYISAVWASRRYTYLARPILFGCFLFVVAVVVVAVVVVIAVVVCFIFILRMRSTSVFVCAWFFSSQLYTCRRSMTVSKMHFVILSERKKRTKNPNKYDYTEKYLSSVSVS